MRDCKVWEKMGDEVSSKERILPTTSACGVAVWRSLEVASETFHLENELLLAVQKSSRSGSSRSSLTSFMRVSPKIWCWRDGGGRLSVAMWIRRC